MHRSGTSATSGILNQLGAALPLRMLPARFDNEKGFFEPREISAIHDRMLTAAGTSWAGWEAMSPAWLRSATCEAFVDELVAATRVDFPGDETFVLKDPRICRFPDLWLEVLERIGAQPVVVSPYRHPLEVAESLRTRDGFPIAHGLLMWLRHVLDAERATRRVRRTFNSFGNLLRDWQGEIASVVAVRGLDLPKSSVEIADTAEGFLDETLRHHRAEAGGVTLHAWFADSFAALERLRVDPYDSTAMAALDSIGSAFETASTALHPAFSQLSHRIGNVEERAKKAESDLATSEAKLAVFHAARGRREAEMTATKQALADSETMASRVPQLEASLNAARLELAEVRQLANKVPGLETELAGSLASLAAAEVANGRLAGELAITKEDIGAAAVRIAYLEHRLRTAQSKFERTLEGRMAAVLSRLRSSSAE